MFHHGRLSNTGSVIDVVLGSCVGQTTLSAASFPQARAAARMEYVRFARRTTTFTLSSVNQNRHRLSGLRMKLFDVVIRRGAE